MAEDSHHQLPRRVIGANLPADFHLNAVAVGRARVEYPPGSRWSNDEKSMRILLNGLRPLAARRDQKGRRVTTPPSAGPVVGASYLLADPDYRYGEGPLLARVTRVIRPVDFGEGGRVDVWWEVEAVVKPPTYTGTESPRHLYIRAACLPTARRRTG